LTKASKSEVAFCCNAAARPKHALTILDDRDRGVVVLQRAVEAALVPVGVAAVGQGHGIVGIETDRRIELRDGAIELLLAQQRDTAAIERA